MAPHYLDSFLSAPPDRVPDKHHLSRVLYEDCPFHAIVQPFAAAAMSQKESFTDSSSIISTSMYLLKYGSSANTCASQGRKMRCKR